MTLLAWTFAALMHFAPPSNHDRAPWAEPREESWRRYSRIAEAIVTVCERESKAPKSCAALLAAIAIGESGLARDADEGPCYRRGGYAKRCDAGKAASVWQCQAIGFYTVAEMFADREKAAEQALRVARSSLGRCGKLDARDRLSGLSGRCIDGPGPWRARYDLWQTIRAWNP